MSVELCGDCLRLFDAEMSIEEPKRFLLSSDIEDLPVESSWCVPMQSDVLFVWRCPECSLELSPR
jgi:hypothetical protein